MTIMTKKLRRTSVAAAALTISAALAGTATATANVTGVGVDHMVSSHAAAVNTVKVTDALVRSEPNTHSTKLDVVQRGNGVDLYCWVSGGSGNYIWFRAHPWGSRFTGWMRADLINWATYPAPYRC
jgi:hypothetical protein